MHVIDFYASTMHFLNGWVPVVMSRGERKYWSSTVCYGGDGERESASTRVYDRRRGL